MTATQEGADVPKKTRRTKKQMDKARAQELRDARLTEMGKNAGETMVKVSDAILNKEEAVALLEEADKPITAVPVLEDFKIYSLEKMNDLALRIFRGQSPHLPMLERVGRIRLAIKNRGWIEHIDKLELPADNYKRYL